MKKILIFCLLGFSSLKAQAILEETRLSGPRVFLFAEDFYSRAQIKVKQG
ncbi:MAG: hypothetical protein RLZZ599_724, partial [Bacteroidota bacterium]